MKVLGKDKLQLTGRDWNIQILVPSSYDSGEGRRRREKRIKG